MRSVSVAALAGAFPIDDIERALVFNFMRENGLDHARSSYLSAYLNGFAPSGKLLRVVEALGHSGIEDIVADMEQLIPAEDRRTNGAYFTPQYIVDYIVASVAPRYGDKVVDPSCGSGAFLLGVVRYFERTHHKSVESIVKENLYGVDVLAYNTRRAKLLIILYAMLKGAAIDEDDLHIQTADSLRLDWPRQFDAVVGNPPYVKYQDLDYAARAFLSATYQTTRLGTYNLYFAFFELGLRLLTDDGRLGFITPNNYFTSLAGEPLRRFFQGNQSIFRIVDFGATKVFDVQTYTAITFINRVANESIDYARIERGEAPAAFLASASFSPNSYAYLSAKKWRLLCGDERENIRAIESAGRRLGDLMDICAGIATLKDDVYAFDPLREDDKYYYFVKESREFKVEKDVTKPLVKISDVKTDADLERNRRRIVFPYRTGKGKAVPLAEDELKADYPFCHEYLLSAKDALEGRDKGRRKYSPFYAYGRTQGLNRFGARVYTPTFSLKPRFIFDAASDGFFSNGYGLYFKEDGKTANPIASVENSDVLLKVLNSCVMDYYVAKTSVAIEGGYPCFQKNFIERFTLPKMTAGQISELRDLTRQEDIDRYVCGLYQINIPEPKRRS